MRQLFHSPRFQTLAALCDGNSVDVAKVLVRMPFGAVVDVALESGDVHGNVVYR